MVSFGLIDVWQPEPGRMTWWRATEAARAAATQAPSDPTPAALIQEAYLRSARRNQDAGFRFSRLCLLNFDLPGQADLAAMDRALHSFVRRHNTFHSWFVVDEDDSVHRHVLDPELIEFEHSDLGERSSEQILEYIQTQVPGPMQWDCFAFAVVQHAESFTICMPMDHLVTDGVSQAIQIFDVSELYKQECGATDASVFPTGSYLDYCIRERERTAPLTLESPEIAQWVELVTGNGGDLPTFPLDLGKDDENYTRTSAASFHMLTPQEAEAVDAACAAVGAKFSGAVFAADAIAQYELSGRSHYFGLTPTGTRSTPQEWVTVGWFSSLVPIVFDVCDGDSFLQLAAASQHAFVSAKGLTEIPYHRVLELATPETGLRTQPGWTAPMMSYVDVRKLPGSEELDRLNVGVWGSRGSSEEVFVWVNRFLESTSTTLLYPRTEQAEKVIREYVTAMRRVLLNVAANGDYNVGQTESVEVDLQVLVA